MHTSPPHPVAQRLYVLQPSKNSCQAGEMHVHANLVKRQARQSPSTAQMPAATAIYVYHKTNLIIPLLCICADKCYPT